MTERLDNSCSHQGKGKNSYVDQLADRGVLRLSDDGQWCDDRLPPYIPPEEKGPIDISCVGPDSPRCPDPQDCTRLRRR
jgi:hypothetical protein